MFSEEQIGMALRQARAGTPVEEITRKLGVSEETYHRWERRHSRMTLAEPGELRGIREENRRLKVLIAELALNRSLMQDALRSEG